MNVWHFHIKIIKLLVCLFIGEYIQLNLLDNIANRNYCVKRNEKPQTQPCTHFYFRLIMNSSECVFGFSAFQGVQWQGSYLLIKTKWRLLKILQYSDNKSKGFFKINVHTSCVFFKKNFFLPWVCSLLCSENKYRHNIFNEIM